MVQRRWNHRGCMGHMAQKTFRLAPKQRERRDFAADVHGRADVGVGLRGRGCRVSGGWRNEVFAWTPVMETSNGLYKVEPGVLM